MRDLLYYKISTFFYNSRPSPAIERVESREVESSRPLERLNPNPYPPPYT